MDRTLTPSQEKVYKNLMTMSKKEVFGRYVRACCGRIHSAQIGEQRKSWMAFDIAYTTPKFPVGA